MRRAATCLLLCALSAASWAAPDIYLEDSHAGSFYWIAAHLPLNEPVGLVLVDAHSDATALPDSGHLRNQLERSQEPERDRLLQRWRQRGMIGCDAWIEPLMPSPIDSVLWIPALHQTSPTTRRQQDEARRLLTAHAEVSSRNVHDIASRFHVAALEEADEAAQSWVKQRRVVVSIDLDFFAEMADVDIEPAFVQVWRQILKFDDRLAAVTFAVSRPWLKSDAQASLLVELALRHARELQGARIQIEPFASTGPDTSATAAGFYRRGETPPAWNLASSTEPLRALLLAERQRWTVQTRTEQWNQILDSWDDVFPVPGLCLKKRQPGADEVWHVIEGETYSAGFDDQTLLPPDAEVRWFALSPKAASYNMVKQTGMGKMFAENAGSLPGSETVEIVSGHPSSRDLSSLALRPFFDSQTGWGLVQIYAEVRNGTQLRRTRPMAIACRAPGDGIRSYAGEGFGLPYVFGATFLRDGDFTGPETLIGSDCANFIIAALRKTGQPIGWGAPADLRKALQAVPRETAITAEDVERGIIVDFDTHMTLLMEDRGQRGTVDAEDVLAHHLEGFPELISVGELMYRRSYQSFRLLRPRTPEAETIKLVFGGDVMLGRSIGKWVMDSAFQPFAGIAPVLRDADLTVVNLECVLSELGAPATNKRYTLRAPAAGVALLAGAGIDAVSLANNHSMDFGSTALTDMQTAFQKAGIQSFGAGGRLPVKPVILEAGGLRIALAGISAVSEPRELATEDTPGVAGPADLESLRQACAEADLLVAFVHWGIEGKAFTTADQRSLARRLVHAGADIVVGAHPHCLQPLDQFAGRPVAFSLGNLVFDGGIAGSSWQRGTLLEVRVGRHSRKIQSSRLLPVELDAAGLPQKTSAAN